jgi:hypothetical protein
LCQKYVARSEFNRNDEKMCVLDTVAECVAKSSRVGKPGRSVPRTDTGLTLSPPE